MSLGWWDGDDERQKVWGPSSLKTCRASSLRFKRFLKGGDGKRRAMREEKWREPWICKKNRRKIELLFYLNFSAYGEIKGDQMRNSFWSSKSLDPNREVRNIKKKMNNFSFLKKEGIEKDIKREKSTEMK